MDCTSDASTWSNSAYSFTNISSLLQGDTINSMNKVFYASVFCFVSKDFDGSWANISTEGKVSGNVIDKYDLGKKGFWQNCRLNLPLVPEYHLFICIGQREE